MVTTSAAPEWDEVSDGERVAVVMGAPVFAGDAWEVGLAFVGGGLVGWLLAVGVAIASSGQL